MAALDAAEAEGGDVRGRQSAAMIVVPAEGEPWRRTVDLRMTTTPRRSSSSTGCSTLHAPTTSRRGGRLWPRQLDEAGELYAAAEAIAPDSDELLFWGESRPRPGG